MLMHEWIKYRDEQLERVEKQQEDEGGKAAKRDDLSEVQKVADEVAQRADEAQTRRLQALVSRQQRLPLDVRETRRSAQTGEGSSGAKQTREELIERLLDPTLTLRETTPSAACSSASEHRAISAAFGFPTCLISSNARKPEIYRSRLESNCDAPTSTGYWRRRPH